ncbi:hypothetical protein Aduo_019473 [Ancylostoma duodenale]
MATATTEGFACTYDLCNDDPQGIAVCLFNNHKQLENSTLYEPTWNESEICSSCKDTCTDYLCLQTPYTPVPIRPLTCSDDTLTFDSHNTALWMHNYYRKLLASGWAKDPKSKGGYATTAKQMLELNYDWCSGGTSGATKTYDLIKGCPQDNPKATSGYSLNFLRIQNYTVSEQDALEHAIKTWWGQLETAGLGSDTMFNGDPGISSFANMAFDQAEKVACAVKTCTVQGQTLIACQYSPGITNGNKIYEKGDVCSGCNKLTPSRKCSNPRGLCLNP